MDLATSAKPHETTKVLQGWADNRYHVGVRFGTVGARKGGRLFEITTFREEVYAEEHRKPAVTFAKDIETDLSRRDFTINAMAVRLPDGEFVDPFGGREAPGREDARHAARARGRRSRTTRCGCCARHGSSSQLDVTPAERVVRAIARDARPARRSCRPSGSVPSSTSCSSASDRRRDWR